MILAEFLLISETSALTFSVAGTIKEGLTIVVSHFVFHDKFTKVNTVGLIVMVVGVSLFNWYKVQKMREGSKPAYPSEDVAESQQTEEKELLMTVVDPDLSTQIDALPANTPSSPESPHLNININVLSHSNPLATPSPLQPKASSSSAAVAAAAASSLATSFATSAAEAVAAATSLATSVTATSPLASSSPHVMEAISRNSSCSPKAGNGGTPGSGSSSKSPNGQRISPLTPRAIEMLRAEGDGHGVLREKSQPMDDGYWKSLRSVASPGAAGLHERRGDDKSSFDWV
eukprot:TRINITY_DN2860_c0_g1_i1.p1 TRINITY_DN2860_c0_g1~~TRINITY_DN2860_c0_g1_i1.p1  ORF type:complete len:288 (+),score=57.97 TRINITY_DN2860_c0_g1_i1:318-1181(+)